MKKHPWGIWSGCPLLCGVKSLEWTVGYEALTAPLKECRALESGEVLRHISEPEARPQKCSIWKQPAGWAPFGLKHWYWQRFPSCQSNACRSFSVMSKPTAGPCNPGLAFSWHLSAPCKMTSPCNENNHILWWNASSTALHVEGGWTVYGETIGYRDTIPCLMSFDIGVRSLSWAGAWEKWKGPEFLCGQVLQWAKMKQSSIVLLIYYHK